MAFGTWIAAVCGAPLGLRRLMCLDTQGGAEMEPAGASSRWEGGPGRSGGLADTALLA